MLTILFDGIAYGMLLFVVACGLPSGPATAVAAITRGLLVLVDAGGGVLALASVAYRGRVR